MSNPTKIVTSAAGGAIPPVAQFLLHTMAGCDHAAAIMPWGTFGPIRLPESEAERLELIRAHVVGGPAAVTFAPMDKPEELIRLSALELGAYCPRSDGLCGWVGIDLDGATHGARALVAPDSAARCIAERCDNAGLFGGLLVVKSRSGSGRHCWIIPPSPVPLADACLAVAAIGVHALRVAGRDVAEYECPHAFRKRDGGIAAPGEGGAFELNPKSTGKPARGYVLALPFGGVAARRGGGVAFDVFADPPQRVELAGVPSCDPEHWRRFIAEARAELRKRKRPQARPRPIERRPMRRTLDPRTDALLAGALPETKRNNGVYWGFADLLRCGASVQEAAQLAGDGGRRCGLSEREIQATLHSAIRRWGNRP